MSTQIATAYDYRQFIIATAEAAIEEAIEEALESNSLDLETVQDSMYEMVADFAGNTDVAIHSHYHLDVIKYSDYADAFIDEFGREYAGQIVANRGIEGLHAAIAVYGIESDIRKWLSNNAEGVIESRSSELRGEE